MIVAKDAEWKIMLLDIGMILENSFKDLTIGIEANFSVSFARRRTWTITPRIALMRI